jgi:hypothetical protein
MKDTVSWHLTLVTLKEMHQCVGEIYIIHVQGRQQYCWKCRIILLNFMVYSVSAVFASHTSILKAVTRNCI